MNFPLGILGKPVGARQNQRIHIFPVSPLLPLVTSIRQHL